MTLFWTWGNIGCNSVSQIKIIQQPPIQRYISRHGFTVTSNKTKHAWSDRTADFAFGKKHFATNWNWHSLLGVWCIIHRRNHSTDFNLAEVWWFFKCFYCRSESKQGPREAKAFISNILSQHTWLKPVSRDCVYRNDTVSSFQVVSRDTSSIQWEQRHQFQVITHGFKRWFCLNSWETLTSWFYHPVSDK